MTVAPDQLVPVALDQSPRSGTPGILSSYMFGPAAVSAAGLDPEERREIWLAALAARYGPRALEPRAHLETDWAAEPWSLGGMIGISLPAFSPISVRRCVSRRAASTGPAPSKRPRCTG
jgi:monoamine oxidase